MAVLGVTHDVTARRVRDRRRSPRASAATAPLFEDSPVALWEEDHSAAKAYLEQLMASGVDDLASFLREHPAEYAAACRWPAPST